MSSAWLTTVEAAPLLARETSEGVRSLMTEGTKVPGGVVKLEYRWIGSRYVTTAEWIEEYIRTVTAAKDRRDGDGSTPLPPGLLLREAPDATAARMRREKDEAARMLEGVGS